MKLKTFLIISSLSVVLSGCNSIFSKHVKCDDESGLKLVEEVLREDLNKLLENELKGFIQRGEIKDLDPAKLKLSAQSVQFKLVDSRTDHIDPDSTKTTCSLDLTVNIPSDLVKKSDEARTKVGFDTVEAQALKEDIDYIAEMKRFSEGKTNIMVATTVIEVGVNVPNASVMIIESAERFGLSQLHQLRGRVGRGAEQSYCILMTSHKLSSDSKTRMETMVQTNDGFEIAEVDLKLRGPGDLMGTQQSGVLNLQIADLVRDRDTLALARNYALKLLKEDAGMQKPEHAALRSVFIEMTKKKNIWNYIS